MRTIQNLCFSVILVGLLASPVAAKTVWNVSLWGKPRAFTFHVEELARLVNQKTQGDFELRLSYGGLSKARENLDGISIGAFEMAQFCSFYHKDKNPTITVTELPFSRDKTLAQIAEISSKVYSHPIVKKDLARWNAVLLMPSPQPQYGIVGKGSPIVKLSDFDGRRVRGPGGLMGVLDKYGAVGTSVPFAEVRQSMDSGVIDAAAFAPHAHLATTTYKIGNWYTTNLNLGTADCPVVVNRDALDALSARDRNALLGSVDEAIRAYVDNYEQNAIRKYQSVVKQTGLVPVTFSTEQAAALNADAEYVRASWIRKNQAQFDSKSLFDFVNKLYSQ